MNNTENHEKIMEVDGYTAYITNHYSNGTVYIWVDVPKNWEQLQGLEVDENGKYDYLDKTTDYNAWKKASSRIRAKATKVMKAAAEKHFNMPLAYQGKSVEKYEAQRGMSVVKVEPKRKAPHTPHAGGWATPFEKAA